MTKQDENIWTATGDGDMARVEQLVEADRTLVNAKDENGYTPLHAAASWKQPKLLEFLIKNGGDVNITDNDGDTPLHICEDLECAQLLLDNGANPEAENDEGLSPVHTTLENEATEVTELICAKLNIPVPVLQEVQETEQINARDDSMSGSKLEDLSNWIMQQVDENSETDEEALRAMVTKYIMQNLRNSTDSNADDTVAATVATSTDRVSQDNDSISGQPPQSK
ncbi:hypothetical protein GGI13_005081 [Coemansia sp. RSA 455]|nr:hypothetical protein GGI14_000606 [Coemansia sp. S680]KAJ2040686.1 hypothetical protein H4S03_000871 [Coemansia sp. S3946]KAJ2045312.1 hypothetical protein H4S04_005716 [Coemansia sp. S16]KAJ2064404.1 hypothetical protein GGI08_002391 [Coemansia sp. S2]KAJ2071811.1 hypothetical protein GGH13_003113 [Coemansia sp. S155-1]KAJ2114397.1 hypothetical protein IW146_003118 [Coemansia sp. RSA 922]KAJ2247352.1 hypothetical protein GGI13_005081 [Coemansia sp. RSA 455]KAJ2349354.1 hypothetical prote